jgi:hypothetical protein
MIGVLPGLASFFGLNVTDERDFDKTQESAAPIQQLPSHKVPAQRTPYNGNKKGATRTNKVVMNE